MSPLDLPAPDLDQAKEELREGIKNSRVLVRQSRILIELSESDPAAPRSDDEYGVSD